MLVPETQDRLRVENEHLRAENERLREELRYYETLPSADDWTPRFTLGLTRTQGGVLRLLVQRGRVSSEQLLHHCYHGDPDRIPTDPQLPKVYICQLRKKLRPFGLEIETIWGDGYRMSPEHREAVRAMERSK